MTGIFDKCHFLSLQCPRVSPKEIMRSGTAGQVIESNAMITVFRNIGKSVTPDSIATGIQPKKDAHERPAAAYPFSCKEGILIGESASYHTEVRNAGRCVALLKECLRA